MNPRLSAFIVLIAAVGVVVFLTTRPKPAPANRVGSPVPSVATEAAPAPSSPQLPAIPPASEPSESPSAPNFPVPAMAPVAPEPMPVAAVPPDEGNPAALPPAPGARIDPGEIAKDLDEISLNLRDYRTRMAQNPIGNNAEITRALMGGESVTRAVRSVWRAVFFHQLSATRMEIHSAGPDRKLGTEDDIVLR